MNDTLYIFVDEGGNLDFSNKGTKFFTLTALSKVRPFVIYEPLVNLKYDLWEKDIEFEYFHATEDTYTTRNEVFNLISENITNFTIDSVIVEKNKTHPSLQDHAKFYIKIFDILFNYILTRYKNKFSKIFIITDEIPVKRKKKDVEKAIKSYVSRWIKDSVREYKIFHYSSKSDINLQIVDYFNWSIFRKWERNKLENYDLIKEAIASEFDVFWSGVNKYY
ncbi:MAG: DUF3800 domain-containing protein [Melioribacteraceae bacterium]|nr:DUF3800 domain-containing protein [Melioribacteraceae bacterium]MCF8355012.1 DUF3800 domain-containing protein [Melioribacteraceae bacterium]MCF8394337.1 DUF3800 domain-containing protein [Melioribacteraceae bacterium]MCF8420016.1 DUF3800 domain-containing protein [Melioribacteraceae bacterium]